MKSLKDVRRDALKMVVPKNIERGEPVMSMLFKEATRAAQGGPPSTQGNSRGPKHGSEFNGKKGPDGKHTERLKLKGAMLAICVEGDFKNFGNSPGLEFKKLGGEPNTFGKGTRGR